MPTELIIPAVARRCAYFARLASLIAVTVGSLVIVGWLLDIRALMSVMPGFVSMKPNAARCFVLAGFALWRLALNSSGRAGARLRWL
ncbi:MAG: hypothetical protein H7Y43_00505, partial [Akkermansiaceae bacterium]|nr:hypothetical protein [Verrucomicrobiales bacterium]